MWNRLAHFDPADLDAAFTERTVVKASLMRITLHAVNADDYPALHQVMVSSLRAARLGDPRFTGGGLTIPDLDALLPHLADFTAPHQDGGRADARGPVGVPASRRVVGATDLRPTVAHAE